MEITAKLSLARDLLGAGVPVEQIERALDMSLTEIIGLRGEAATARRSSPWPQLGRDRRISRKDGAVRPGG